MAGWGTGSFENEDAAAWLAKLGAITPAELMKILSDAAENSDYVEAPAASVVVAAAEVIATAYGSPGNGTPPQVTEWVAKNPQMLNPAINDQAIRALEHVRRNSELKDLWLQADGLNDWIAAIKDLQSRLAPQ